MLKIFHKSRKYPITRDQYGRSARRQSFDLFTQGYRPAQISKENLVTASMKTLLRYFEDWKKQEHRSPRSILRKLIKNDPEFTHEYVQIIADYLEVPPEDIIARIQKPWGIEQLTIERLPNKKLATLQSTKEARLNAALKLIYFGERLYENSPEQDIRLITEIVTLDDNTTLTISKIEGQITIRKESIQEIN
ncbi:hypothetical protein ACFLU4_01760 [Chloroflexota bacterium]